MEGPPLGPGGEDITWPDQVAPRGRKASSTRKIKPQTSNLKKHANYKKAKKRSSSRLAICCLLLVFCSASFPMLHLFTSCYDAMMRYFVLCLYAYCLCAVLCIRFPFHLSTTH